MGGIISNRWSLVGAGGLALGAARAGFAHAAVLDWDNNSCETLRRNKGAARVCLRLGHHRMRRAFAKI